MRIRAAASIAVALTMASPAQANGRFPFAGQLVVSPTTKGLMAMRASFGLLVSQNGGTDWEWVCEIAMGYGGEEDPTFAWLEGHTVVGATFEGLTVSHEAGCGFARQGGPLDRKAFVDVAGERTRPRSAVALASHIRAQDGGG